MCICYEINCYKIWMCPDNNLLLKSILKELKDINIFIFILILEFYFFLLNFNFAISTGKVILRALLFLIVNFKMNYKDNSIRLILITEILTRTLILYTIEHSSQKVG